MQLSTSVNTKDKDGRTALMWAKEKKYHNIMKLLKQAGAND